MNSCVEMSVQAIKQKKAVSYPEDVTRALGALALFADRGELSRRDLDPFEFLMSLEDALWDEINHYCLPAVVDLCSNPVTEDKDKRIQVLSLWTLLRLLTQCELSSFSFRPL